MSETITAYAAMGCEEHGRQRFLFKTMPFQHRGKCDCWHGREPWLARDYKQQEFFDLIFPKDIGPNQCKPVTIASLASEEKA